MAESKRKKDTRARRNKPWKSSWSAHKAHRFKGNHLRKTRTHFSNWPSVVHSLSRGNLFPVWAAEDQANWHVEPGDH
jgi:hypothetical protein